VGLRKLVTVVAVVIVSALGLGAYRYARRSLPMMNGTVAVPRVGSPVEIIRDADAVPHIFASSKLDAFVGLGYVHAQDRLWQMEFQRRIGFGRLSEIFGAATIPQDRFLRTVGFGRAARAAWDRLPPDAREAIDAYVAGVNAFLDTHHGGALPPEFSVLRFEPEPWSGPDVLVWTKMMAWDLSANYAMELVRRDLAARVGAERMAELVPPYPQNGLSILGAAAPTEETRATTTAHVARGLRRPVAPSPPPGRNSEDWTAAFAHALQTGDARVSRFLRGGAATEGLGSNNWVVDGTLTVSGKPLLANDPHLATNIPSLWYLAHLSAGDFEVAGGTLPGTPAVAIGRNRHIAWGETNMFADVEDLYRERLDPSGTSAEFKGAFEPMRVIKETINVSGRAPVEVVVRITRHGPLVSDAINANNAESTAATRPAPIEPLAFRWTALDDEDQTVTSFLRLNMARNWTEFTAALKDFSVPSQNFVYADTEGHIGYYAPGRVPIRAGGDGSIPADGWTGENEWTGWIPFEEMPHVFDPPSHFIVTANHRPVPADYPYFLSLEYHHPFRAQRITDLIQEKRPHNTESFRDIQADTLSLHAQALLPLLLRRVHAETTEDRQAVDLLSRWNFDARGDRAEPAIFAAWFFRLGRALVEDELGRAATSGWQRRFTFVHRFVVNALGTESQWCDDVGTPARESCDDVVAATLHEAVSELQLRLGGDLRQWRWQDVHRAVFPHQGLDAIGLLRPLLSRSVPSAGDWSTVNVGATAIDRPLDQTEVPGYRQIVDLSPANDSRFLDAVGESGHFLSPHYDDLLDNWREVRHLPMRMDREAIERGAIGRLTLTAR
jgi:penicillin amidase